MEQESKFLKIFARFSPPLLQSIFANFVELDCIDYCFLVASCNRQYEYIPKVSNPKLFLGKVVINRQKKGEDLPFEFFIFHSTKQLVWKLLKMSHLNFHDKIIMCSITVTFQIFTISLIWRERWDFMSDLQTLCLLFPWMESSPSESDSLDKAQALNELEGNRVNGRDYFTSDGWN